MVFIILMSDLVEGLFGLLGFIGSIILLFFFLHWLSGVTNTKFVTRMGGSVVADNTAKNKPYLVRIDKSIEQINLEEKLFTERVALRNSQNEDIKNRKGKEIEKEISRKEEKLKYGEEKKRYEAELCIFNDELPMRDAKFKELKEKLKDENISDNQRTSILIEITSLAVNVPKIPLLPNSALQTLTFINYHEIDKKHKIARQLMRQKHSELIEFDNGFERIRFIETDFENDIERTKLVDLNAK